MEQNKKINKRLGRTPWNKGKKGVMPEPWNKGKINCYKKETLELWSKHRKGFVPWNKGKTGVYTKEQLENITTKTREAMKNPDVLKRLSESHKGYIFPQSQRDKVSKGNKGKIRTEEHKEHYRKARALKVFKYYDTEIELIMEKSLKDEGIVFKTHVPLKGQPDIFIEPNICIFVDGDYWHGNPIKYKAEDYLTGGRTMGEKWEYDKNISDTLCSQGYIVLRFWETDIKNNLQDCINKIKIITNGDGGKTC